MQFRPTRFEILPVVIKNLIIINGLVFLAQITLGQKLPFSIVDTFALHAWQSQLFKPWQLITHMFVHANANHIISNMLSLWLIGSIVENYLGAQRFLFFYLICGLGAALGHMSVLYFENESIIKSFYGLSTSDQSKYQPFLMMRLNAASLGASGAVMGILASAAYFFPNSMMMIHFLFPPIKLKWAAILLIVQELYMAHLNSAGDNVGHIAHIGGAVVGFLLAYFWNKNNRKTFY
jgi:membrane associated rhomboid family serine protease